MNRISAEVKSQAIQAAISGEVSVAHIVSRYGVSRQSVYHWKNKYRNNNRDHKAQHSSCEFIEIKHIKASAPTSVKKLSISLADYTITISGKIAMDKIIKMINFLEA